MASKAIPETRRTLPSMIDVGPKWAEMRDKLQELNAREQELLDAIHKPRGGNVVVHQDASTTLKSEAVSLAEQSRRSAIGWVQQSPKPKAVAKERHPGAVELLGSLLPEPTPEELAPPQLLPSWPGQPELDALGEEIETVRAAIGLLTPATAKAHAEASKLFCEARRSDYADVANRLVQAATALGEAIIDHRNYLRDARIDGAAVSFLRPVSTEHFGPVAEAGTPLMRLINDCIDAGHVDPNQHPAWKTPTREAWSKS